MEPTENVCLLLAHAGPLFLKIGLFKLLRSGDSKPLLKSHVLLALPPGWRCNKNRDDETYSCLGEIKFSPRGLRSGIWVRKIRVPPPMLYRFGVGVLFFCGPKFRERGFWNGTLGSIPAIKILLPERTASQHRGHSVVKNLDRSVW